jgi:ribosomal protein S18 acetylase RimI-like enzyme
VRGALRDDAVEIARVHVAAWRAGYKGQVPDWYLDNLNVGDSQARWRKQLERESAAEPTVLVVEGDGKKVVGVTAVGRYRLDPEQPFGEIWMLNVDPATWRRGYGTSLLMAGSRTLASKGYTEAVLWVLHSNSRARQFYEAAGWVLDDAERVDHRDGFRLREVRYRGGLTK